MAIEYRSEPEYWEFVDGSAWRKVSPRRAHTLVQGAFVVLLRTLGRGFGESGPEWRMRLPARPKRTELLPDVSFYSFESVRGLEPAERDYPPFAPDIAVEIRSPGDSLHHLREKVTLYLAHGSLVVFDVDPSLKTMAVYDEFGVRTLRGADAFVDARIPWLQFSVNDLFVDL